MGWRFVGGARRGGEGVKVKRGVGPRSRREGTGGRGQRGRREEAMRAESLPDSTMGMRHKNGPHPHEQAQPGGHQGVLWKEARGRPSAVPHLGQALCPTWAARLRLRRRPARPRRPGPATCHSGTPAPPAWASAYCAAPAGCQGGARGACVPGSPEAQLASQ
eukprot:360893-Chlamydomonas_euryale.AAC.1